MTSKNQRADAVAKHYRIFKQRALKNNKRFKMGRVTAAKQFQPISEETRDAMQRIGDAIATAGAELKHNEQGQPQEAAQ